MDNEIAMLFKRSLATNNITHSVSVSDENWFENSLNNPVDDSKTINMSLDY